MSEPASRLAVAFGSSFLGFPTHLGFLRSLVSSDWRPAKVSGSSAGAIVAGLYAAGVSLEDMEVVFTRSNLRGYFREWMTPIRLIGTALGLPGCTGIFVGDKLRGLLRELVGDIQIQDCRAARLHLAVVNLHTSQIELRDRGPLIETILASCALPGLIAPRRISDTLLWDGGLGSCVPVEAWIDDQAVTHIVGHSIIHECQLRARERADRLSFFGVMAAGHQLTADELLRWKMELARRSGKIVASVETTTPRPRLGFPLTLPPSKPWPQHSRDLMELGAVSAQRVVSQFNKSVVNTGDLPASLPVEPAGT